MPEPPQIGLAQRRELRIPSGTIGIRETGTGAPVVFISGIVANGLVWRNVAPALAGSARCIAPDWPLGSHTPAMPDADLSLPGLARIVIDVLDALGLERVALCGNGYGGDVAQVVASQHPDRVNALVLIACNTYGSDPWPTKALRWLTCLPGAATVQPVLLRSRTVQRLPFVYGWATKRPVPDEIMTAYLRPLRSDAAVAADFRRFLRALRPGHVAAASRMLATFSTPTLIISPSEDRVFPTDGARRLAAEMPNARFVSATDSYAWMPEDRPEELARLLGEFLTEVSQR